MGALLVDILVVDLLSAQRGKMKVFSIVVYTALVSAVALALPASEQPTLWEQESALYDKVLPSTLYQQQSDLFDSLVEVGATKEAQEKAPSLYEQQRELFDTLVEVEAKPAKKKKAKKSKKTSKKASGPVHAKQVKKDVKKVTDDHGDEIKKAGKRFDDNTLGIFKKNKAMTKADAKADKKQSDLMKADTKKQKKSEKKATKALKKAGKDARTRANNTWKTEVKAVYKAEHPDSSKKGLAREKKDDTFIKKMDAVAQGKAVIAGGDKVYLKKNPGNVPFGKKAKKKAAKKKGAKKKGGKKKAKKGAKKKGAKKKGAKKKELDLYQQEAALFEEMAAPRRTAERIALDKMRDMERLAQAKSNALYEQALNEPVDDVEVDPVEELMQFDKKITPLSDHEEQLGAQRVKLAAEQELYEDMVAPRRTAEQKNIDEMKDDEREAQAVATQLFQENLGHQRTQEQRAVDEMKFAEDVMQDEMTNAFNNALK